MNSFNQRINEFRINEPATYARNLRGAAIGQQDETYLFLICAYDYIYNPEDIKISGMSALFLTPDHQRVIGTRETPWFVNIGAEETKQISTLMWNPEVMVSRECIRFIPPMFGKRSPATGNTPYSAPLATIGGIKNGGAANYNLFSKAIEVCCAGIGNMNLSIAEAIKAHRDKAITSAARAMLVDRYNTLRSFYNDQTLTKFGLIYR
jgi:hypothetical protein